MIGRQRADRILIGFFLTVMLWTAGPAPAQVELPEEEPLRGECSRDSLEMNWPEFQPGLSDLSPEALDFLRDYPDSIHVLVLFGTWCSDSKREVPRFFEILDAVHNPRIGYTLYGLDRSKRDARGLAEKYGIRRVPTFIFFKNGLQLGRVVESPQVTLEEDWRRLLEYYDRMKVPEPVDRLLFSAIFAVARP